MASFSFLRFRCPVLDSRVFSALYRANSIAGMGWGRVRGGKNGLQIARGIGENRRAAFPMTGLPSLRRRTKTRRQVMSKVRVLVGTRKGAFILNADGTRKNWEVSGPR